MKYHHSALSRGYIRKGHGWTQQYNGKFGKGEIRHIPNAETTIKTNNYHLIEYYIEDNQT